jgi:DNA-binding protein HU-beta
MTKAELVAAISERTGVAQSGVEDVLKALEDVVTESVAKGGDKIALPGFLSFERTRRAARTARNPQTGATINVPATNAVKVSAGSRLKAAAKAS